LSTAVRKQPPSAERIYAVGRNSGSVLKENVDWIEDLFRHFVSDFLIAFWNVTMQDAFLRILMPLLIVAAVFKTGEMSMQRLLR
jgi:hypothetical protein